jgi:hypothetical protein
MDSKRRSSARSVTGRQSHWTFYLEDGPFAVENYFLSVEIHDEALRAAGFRNVRWHQPMLPPKGQSAYGGVTGRPCWITRR